MRRAFTLVLAIGLAASCTKPAQNSTAAGVRNSTNVITREEIATAPNDNLLETIRRLRPAFVRPRSTASASNSYPVVYVDGIRRGSLDYLRSIPNGQVAEVRYISALDATTKYGMNVEAGVIDVKLLRR